MKIAKIKITNFKCYEETFTLSLNEGLNLIVGANEAGKTTILEAILRWSRWLGQFGGFAKLIPGFDHAAS
ncbi:MAG: AAA family ATPase [Devosia sp.]